MLEKDLVFDITGQEGRRFWDTGKDTRSFVFADTDGFWNGQLEGDTLSFCYMHTGGKSRSTVVSCSEVRRAR